jgi:hypothetical protein
MRGCSDTVAVWQRAVGVRPHEISPNECERAAWFGQQNVAAAQIPANPPESLDS